MSNEPSNSGNLPGRSRPNLSDLAKDTTEQDLWNMDEEEEFSAADAPEAPQTELKVLEEESTPPPAPVPESPKKRRKIPAPVPKASPPPEESAAPVKDLPLFDRQADSSPPDEIPADPRRERQSPDSRAITIGAESNRRNAASRNDRREPPRSAIKDTFEDLDGHDQEPDSAETGPRPEALPSAPEAASPEPETVSPAPEPPSAAPETPAEPSPAGNSEPLVEELWDDTPVTSEPDSPAGRPVAPGALDHPAEPREPSPLAKALVGMNRRDLLAIGAFFFVLLLGALWGISQFSRQLTFKQPDLELPATPISGKWIHIDEIRTSWRQPVTSGPNPDVVRRETAVIPVLHLTLGETSSRGVLRAIFRNADGEIIGDAISQSVEGGRFGSSGQNSASLAATAGFTQMSEFRAYQSEKPRYWTVELFEGPSSDAPSSEFVLLTRAPILRFED